MGFTHALLAPSKEVCSEEPQKIEQLVWSGGVCTMYRTKLDECNSVIVGFVSCGIERENPLDPVGPPFHQCLPGLHFETPNMAKHGAEPCTIFIIAATSTSRWRRKGG